MNKSLIKYYMYLNKSLTEQIQTGGYFPIPNKEFTRQKKTAKKLSFKLYKE